MLPIFCLRLACGLSGALLLLSPAETNPRFQRSQFLIVLGLTATAAVFLGAAGGPWLWLAVSGIMLFALLGSLTAWSAARGLDALTALSAAMALWLAAQDNAPEESLGWLLAAELSSAALLGTATTAMLLGHSYLIAPTMSVTPLLRLLVALFDTLLLRSVIAGSGLGLWAGEHSLTILNEVTLFLPVRWGIGLVGPFVLAIMAWQTARIRSTQSATGILYVVVILTFLGELVSQVLLRNDLLYAVKGGPLS